MNVITRTLSISVNPDRLLEDVKAAGLPVDVIGYPGYEPETRRKYNLRKEPHVYHTATGQSGTVEYVADPGYVRVISSRALTTAEERTLDGLLAAHDHTVLSTGQAQRDQEKADLLDIKNTLAAGQNLTLTQLSTFSRIALSREG